jgi:predicted PurR-regulated permease PerM
VNGRTEVRFSVRTLALVAAVGAGAWAVASIGSALLLLFLALFLALVLDPLVTRLERAPRLGRGAASTIVVLAFVIAFGLIATVVLVPLIGALRDFVLDLPTIVESIRQSGVFRSLDARFDLGAEIQTRAIELADDVPSAAVDVVGLGGAVAEFLFSVFAVAFLTLFLLIDLPRLERGLHSLLEPATSERVAGLRTQITETISRYALGAVVIATIAGTVEGTTAWLLGAPFPLALALIAGLTGLVPQVGATIGGAILVLATLTQGIPEALVMLLVVLAYQQLENYVLQPTIQGRAAEISGFFVLASVIVGAAFLGVLGALVAVPLTAAAQIVVRELTADRRARMAALRAATPR